MITTFNSRLQTMKLMIPWVGYYVSAEYRDCQHLLSSIFYLPIESQQQRPGKGAYCKTMSCRILVDLISISHKLYSKFFVMVMMWILWYYHLYHLNSEVCFLLIMGYFFNVKIFRFMHHSLKATPRSSHVNPAHLSRRHHSHQLHMPSITVYYNMHIITHYIYIQFIPFIPNHPPHQHQPVSIQDASIQHSNQQHPAQPKENTDHAPPCSIQPI